MRFLSRRVNTVGRRGILLGCLQSLGFAGYTRPILVIEAPLIIPRCPPADKLYSSIRNPCNSMCDPTRRRLAVSHHVSCARRQRINWFLCVAPDGRSLVTIVGVSTGTSLRHINMGWSMNFPCHIEGPLGLLWSQCAAFLSIGRVGS